MLSVFFAGADGLLEWTVAFCRRGGLWERDCFVGASCRKQCCRSRWSWPGLMCWSGRAVSWATEFLTFVLLDCAVLKHNLLARLLKILLKIVENIVNYAHERDMKLIAEGIETIDELKQVIKLKVDYLQGFLLAKPQYLPPRIQEDVIKLIQLLNEK